MTIPEEPFPQSEQDWDLAKLYEDLASVKQQLGKRSKLTTLEMACLRGLLCGCSPPEMAAKLNREPRGLRVDLSRGLYRYVEILTDRPINSLKDWRDVTDWLEAAQYKKSVYPIPPIVQDSLIKIVDIVLRQKDLPIIDIKVRNVGRKVAFLKKIKFSFHQAWTLQGLVFRELQKPRAMAPGTPPSMQSELGLELAEENFVKSRAVEPSFDYEFSMPKAETYREKFIQTVFQTHPNSDPYLEEFNISQCVAGNDVDRFTLTLTLPQPNLEEDSHSYQSNIYHFQLELVYNEDNQTVQSLPLVFWLEPNSPLGKVRYYFEEDCAYAHNPLPAFVQGYSQHNKTVLREVAQIPGIKNGSLSQLLSRISVL